MKLHSEFAFIVIFTKSHSFCLGRIIYFVVFICHTLKAGPGKYCLTLNSLWSKKGWGPLCPCEQVSESLCIKRSSYGEAISASNSVFCPLTCVLVVELHSDMFLPLPRF